MSMSTVLFDPKIMPEFQIDWRRPSSRGEEPFGNLLKRHFDTDQRPRSPKLRDEAAEPVSGRPPRVVMAHAKTLRGEAKRIEDTDRCLPRPADQAGTEPCAAGEEPVLSEDSTAAETDTPEQEATAEAPAETAEGTSELPAVEGEVETVAPVAPAIVSVQPSAEETTDGETIVTVVPLTVPTEQSILPEAADPAAADAPSNGGETDSEAAAEQQAVAAMAEAGLTDGAVALMTDQAAPTEGATAAAPAVAATPALPATPAKQDHPALETEQAPAAAIEPAAIAPARPERSSMDIKLRAGSPARAMPATPASPATSATPAQPAQPHATTQLQPATGSEFGSTGEPFDPSLSEDGTGQGWALHLAQGAASKRPDFVAQLRQHLQNLPAHEQVAVHLQRAVREGTNKFSIQLSPAELGNIHVKLEIDEEKRVTAAVTVERPSTLELLQRDTKGLERALHNAGLNMEGGDLSFSLGRGDQEFAQDLRQSGASAAGGSVLDAESDGDQPEAPVAQVMDTAAGVVNLQV
jgi:flagellar hook-length control protein FliK